MTEFVRHNISAGTPGERSPRGFTPVAAIRNKIDQVRFCRARIPEISVRRQDEIVTSALVYPTLRPFHPWCFSTEAHELETYAEQRRPESSRSTRVTRDRRTSGISPLSKEAALPENQCSEARAEKDCLPRGVAKLLGEAIVEATARVHATRLRYSPRPMRSREIKDGGEDGGENGKQSGRADGSEDPRAAEHGTAVSGREMKGVEDFSATLVNQKANRRAKETCAHSGKGDTGEASRSRCTSGLGGDESPHKPVLLLLGGPSGTGKSTLAPLVTRLLMENVRSRNASLLSEERCSEQCPSNDVGLEDGCVVVSSDHTRKVARVLSQSRNPLLFHSTFELQSVVQEQLESLKGRSKCAREGGGRRGAAQRLDDCETEPETADCPDTAGKWNEDPEDRAGKVEKTRREIEENLQPFSAWFPEKCPSCQESYPCSAVLGLLQQSILLQHQVLGPTIHGLMGERTEGREGSASIDEGNRSKHGGDDSGTNADACASPLKLIVVEGVHLTPGFVRSLQNRYGRQCLSFSMYVHSKDEHSARLQHRRDDSHQPLGRMMGNEMLNLTPTSQVFSREDSRASGDVVAETKRGNRLPVGKELGQANPEKAEARSSDCSEEGKTDRMVEMRQHIVAPGFHGDGSADSGEGSAEKENKYVRNLCNIRCLQIYLCLAAHSAAAGAPPEACKQKAIEAVCKRFASEADDVGSLDTGHTGAAEESDDFVDLARPGSSGQGGTYIVLNRDLYGSLEFMRSAFVSLGIRV
ncbi:hypothetical protein TGARI_223095 [Toxoplasma gondii ARI]|uniref:Uncharacterized protein n=1 Tax=Toxoplasma gondii ARI TaxID=1074872 RepID=A0A139XUN1_TOXGO|nr:hypothetical protein TGARI_223095 [Toxoplasma gondii ARI]